MEDLIPPQIKDSCKLAMPDGLKELMSDITREVWRDKKHLAKKAAPAARRGRSASATEDGPSTAPSLSQWDLNIVSVMGDGFGERQTSARSQAFVDHVLRYQPSDLYKFIADYLSAMLITRDNLSIAGYICNDIANCSCEPELHDELREIGLPEDDINTARDIIVNYLEKGKVDEGNLLMILIKDTKINEDMLPAVQDAIRNAYLRHQAHNTTKYESSDSEQDAMICAAKHTLDLYRKTAPSKEMYGIMAEKIQKSYRAYGVRRDSALKNKNTKSADKAVTLVDPKNRAEMSNSYIAFPNMKYSEEAISMGSSAEQDPDIQLSSSMNNKRLVTMSSTSLAGSYMALPSYKPYSAHDCDILSNLDEFPEREHAHIDYTADNPHFSMVTEDKLFYKRANKKINFNEATKKMGLEADDDSESKDSNQNVSMNGADSDTFYSGDVMGIESNNYDGDTEMERSDVNLGGNINLSS